MGPESIHTSPPFGPRGFQDLLPYLPGGLEAQTGLTVQHKSPTMVPKLHRPQPQMLAKIVLVGFSENVTGALRKTLVVKDKRTLAVKDKH